jgi:RNA polymerase sigma-70 factor (ECF subfamily)
MVEQLAAEAPGNVLAIDTGHRPGHSQDEWSDPLVEQAMMGNTTAFDCLVRRHTRQVYRTALRITAHREDAEDITQETFARAHTALGQFQGNSKFGTWLTRIAVNQALMALRKKKASRIPPNMVGTLEGPIMRDIPDRSPTPEESCNTSELRQSLRFAIGKLPDNSRFAFELRHVHELTTEEAALALGISAAALKSRVLRARIYLRKHLGPVLTAHAEQQAAEQKPVGRPGR